jgi:hypothetical protein
LPLKDVERALLSSVGMVIDELFLFTTALIYAILGTPTAILADLFPPEILQLF